MADPRLVDEKATFLSFGHLLDTRILRALADMGFARPTLVQAKAIPLALDNRDILARARTGSGKTAAYCIPLVQKILAAKSALAPGDEGRQVTRGLVLVPTRELAEQVSAHLRALVVYCDKTVLLGNVASGATTHLQRSLLADKPDIVVATPSRAFALLQSKTLSLSSLDTLVIDEADLILSYGYDDDVRQILSGSHLPRVFQSFLMSATMTEDVEMLRGLTLRNPAILKLEEGEDEAALLSQYVVRCSEVDKFLLTYVILKLRLIPGKCIIFVNDVTRCYRLRLFLEQFAIRSCVLNAELPLNSRYHTVQEFNKGVYDYIIATDESGAGAERDHDEAEVEEKEEREEATEDVEEIEQKMEGVEEQEQEQDDDGDDGDDDEEQEQDADVLGDVSTQREPILSGSTTRSSNESQPRPSKDSKKRKRPDTPPPPPKSESRKQKRRKSGRGSRDKEYGVTRGVDFVDVACVLNFDLPTSARAYTHRVGRTARAGRTGLALSFVVPRAEWGRDRVVGCLPSAREDEAVFARIEKDQGARGSQVKEYAFDKKQVEAFRYRMEDALRAVTRSAIKEARVKELKTEILNSEKLKAHFEDNPMDLEYLRHDKPLHPTRVQAHMKHVPKYLLPRIAPVSGGEADVASTATPPKVGFVPFKKDSNSSRGRGRGRGGSTSGRGRGGKKKSDPLKKFGR